MVESFMAQECDIPLDGVEGVMGSTIRVRLKWEPQLLQHRRTHTTFMGTTRKMTTKMGTTAFNWSLPPKDTSTSEENNKFSVRNIQSKVSDMASSVRSTESPPPKREIPAKGVLTVRIIEARGLQGQTDKLHPQVSVHLGNQHVLKTRKLKKTASPFW